MSRRPLISTSRYIQNNQAHFDKYYWPGVAIEVKNYIKNCDVCNRSKTTTKRPFGQMGKFKVATKPWQVISMDLMGPFVRSSKQNEHLLVICDYFTKMPILVPIRNARANSKNM